MATGETMIIIATIMIGTTMTTNSYALMRVELAFDNLLCFIGQYLFGMPLPTAWLKLSGTRE
jgi:hypothetical protein